MICSSLIANQPWRVTPIKDLLGPQDIGQRAASDATGGETGKSVTPLGGFAYKAERLGNELVKDYATSSELWKAWLVVPVELMKIALDPLHIGEGIYGAYSQPGFHPLDQTLSALSDVGRAFAITGLVSNAFKGVAGLLSRSEPLEILQNLTAKTNAALASLARTVLSAAEYSAAQSSPRVAQMAYGNALERLLARRIAGSESLSETYEWARGPGPDFIGHGRAEGMKFDITTVKGVPSHLQRPYGRDLDIATYVRPQGFTFP